MSVLSRDRLRMVIGPILALILSSLFGAAFTTIPLGYMSEIKSAILSSNSVSFVMYNYGQYTRPSTGGNRLDFAWKGLGYMYEFGPLLTGEVLADNGDTLHVVVDGMWIPTQGSYSPDGLTKWGWLPRIGYSNPASSNLATKNDQASWPLGWTSWRGSANALNEAFYVMDDFSDAEHKYFPFPSDSTKRGLGVSAEVRTYQFGGGLRDAVIIEWKLTNESPRDLARCYFGFYGDPHIGGPSSYNDDLCSYIGNDGSGIPAAHTSAHNTVYCWDADGVGDHGLVAGYMSFKFLETPNSNGLTALQALPYTNSLPNVPKNDPLFWSVLSSESIDSNQAFFTTPGDYILTFSTGPFSLDSGDSTFVKLAVFFSDNYDDMLKDASYMHYASHWPVIGETAGSSGGDSTLAISLLSPTSSPITGSVPVTWLYSGIEPAAKVLLEYSSDNGFSWEPLGWDLATDGSYSWNTTTHRDGVNYLLRAVAYNTDLSRYAYDIVDNTLTVDNPGNAQPEIWLDRSFEGTTLISTPMTIRWNTGDADDSNLTISLAYAFSDLGQFTPMHTGTYSAGQGSYAWDFTALPNASSYRIRISASDATLDTMVVSNTFAIHQEKGSYQGEVFQHVAGKSTPDLRLIVVDTSLVTGDQYELGFLSPHPDSTTKASIRDLNSGSIVLDSWPLLAGVSTPLFDGLKLTIADKPLDIDTTRSGFSRADLGSAVDYNWTVPFSNRVKVAEDWIVPFNTLDTNLSGAYLFPGDTALNQSGQRVVICPFRVIITETLEGASFLILDVSPRNNKWDPGEILVLRPRTPVGTQMSYQVNFHFAPGVFPGTGDTLFVYTQRPLASDDVFTFIANDNYVTRIRETEQGTYFVLEENFPNPFNPATTIIYQIPSYEKVSLIVYDIRGRELRRIVDGYQAAGQYRVSFDATGLSSGLYLYQLRAGGFVQTRKMVYIK